VFLLLMSMLVVESKQINKVIKNEKKYVGFLIVHFAFQRNSLHLPCVVVEIILLLDTDVVVPDIALAA
jgi:hypothetical protein